MKCIYFFDFLYGKIQIQTIILLEAASWISRQCQKGVPMLELILYFGPVILVVLLVLLIITQGYVKAPPDHAYIISGLRKEPRVLVGRAGLKLPFFEQLDKLYLGQITVDIKTDEYIPTNDFINVMVDAVAKVRVQMTRPC